MTTSTKPAKRTRAQLQRDVLELTAQLAHVYHFAAIRKDLKRSYDLAIMFAPKELI